ncbi:hypothetical protein M6B38_208365 [Iris pallida]|uniref:Uncharacterized protein n=1 Tax=Iris pallida TaxID=29817 RepID=A0AAX6E5G9_IRIPA|nr:hypothetical protein M6B38_208365 [Iris pallida]
MSLFVSGEKYYRCVIKPKLRTHVNSLGLVLCTRALSRTFMPVPCSMFYPSRSHTLEVFQIYHTCQVPCIFMLRYQVTVQVHFIILL